MADELPSTPKRKRGVDTLLTPIKFSFDPDRTAEDGGNSPRTKVAHSFRGLAIEGEGGSGVAFGGDEADSATRKRQRQDVDTTDLDAETVPKPEVDRETQREATGRTNPEDTRDIQVADTKVVDLGDARGIRFEVAEGIKLKDTNDIKPDVTEDTKLSRTPQKTTPPSPGRGKAERESAPRLHAIGG